MIPESAPLARVDGVYNAVVVEGDFVGRVMLEGRGAGAGPTASSVVADLIDLARGRATPVWGADSSHLSAAPSVPMAAYTGAYYLRLMVVDRPGVIADVTCALRDAGVSLESMLQHGRSPVRRCRLFWSRTRHARRRCVRRLIASSGWIVCWSGRR